MGLGIKDTADKQLSTLSVARAVMPMAVMPTAIAPFAVETGLQGETGGAGAGLGIELSQNVLHVLVHSAYAAIEDRPDLRIALALCDPAKHFALARGQREKPITRRMNRIPGGLCNARRLAF